MSTTCRLRPDRDAPSGARGAVDELSSAVSDEVWCDARLVVSELVTAAIARRAEGEIALELEAHDRDHLAGRIRAAGQAVETDRDGLGARVIDAVAAHWGVDVAAGWTWFEIRRPRRPHLRIV